MMKYLLLVCFAFHALIASATAEIAERAPEEASNNRALIITDFLYTYNVTRAILRPGAAIPFSTNGPIVGGLAHIEGDTAICL